MLAACCLACSTGGSDASGDASATLDAVAPAADGSLCQPAERRCDLKEQVIVCDPGGQSFSVVEACAPLPCDQGACGCAPDCAFRQCGDDGCGGSCGSCGAEERCSEAGFCGARCPSEGTGREVGDRIGEITLAGETGLWSLGARCGVGATLLIESAVWCSGCEPALAVALEALKDRPEVQLVVVLGETQPGTPPTSGDAAKYRAALGIPAEVPVLLDPLFGELAAAIDHGDGGLPTFVLVDSELVLRYVGGAGGTPGFLELEGVLGDRR